MKHDIFLSYSTRDAETAKELYKFLTGKGMTCWMAPESILPGTEYGEAIIDGIENAGIFLLVFSEHSNESQHVRREVERAVSSHLPVISYRIDRTEPGKTMEYFLMANQWLDASDAPGKHEDELYRAIRALMTRRGKEAAGEEGKEKTCGTEAPAYAGSGRTADGGRKRPAAAVLLALLAVFAVTFLCIILTRGNSRKDNSAVSQLKPGEYIRFGSYYPQGQEQAGDGGIEWIVLRVDETEKRALLLSAMILDMKPYDAAESGRYYKDGEGNTCDRTKLEEYSQEERIEFYGNSDWESSNLRSWLNSPDSLVAYQGQEPVSAGTDDGVNGYHTQPGFLHDFTQQELDRLAETELVTPGNPLSKEEIHTRDRVFLLSVEEAKQYLEGQNISRYAAPTELAAAASHATLYPTYQSFGVSSLPWYLRTPSAEHAGRIFMAGTGFGNEADVFEGYVCSAGGGVRPAVVIELGDCVLAGDGTRMNPYRIE